MFSQLLAGLKTALPPMLTEHEKNLFRQVAGRDAGMHPDYIEAALQNEPKTVFQTLYGTDSPTPQDRGMT